jgi:hypothetical protein
MRQPTPEPWSFDTKRDMRTVMVARSHQASHINIAQITFYPEGEVDVRLMLAAPRLLEAAAASIGALKKGEHVYALEYLMEAVSHAIEGGADAYELNYSHPHEWDDEFEESEE